MTDHIAIRIVAAQELILARGNSLNHLICDLASLHPRLLVKRNDIGRNLNPVLQLIRELLRTVAIPEVCHMTELLSLRACKAVHTLLNKILAHCMLNVRRFNQEVLRQLEIAIILQHACIVYLRLLDLIECIEALVHVVKGLRNLNSTVTSEVKQNDRIAIINRTNRIAILVSYHKARQILISIAAFLAVCLNSLTGRRELSAITHHMDVPAFLNHAPVSFITVHRNDHTAAAGGNRTMIIVIIQRLDDIFQLIDILQSTCLRYITAIQKGMHAYLLQSFLLGFLQHGNQMIDIRMHIAVRQQTDEMQLAIMFLGILHSILPCLRLIDLAGFNRLIDKLCTL